jgi:hypothetical protein
VAKYLGTGASGFVAPHLIDQLIKRLEKFLGKNQG